MNERILFVDDEPQVLRALRLGLSDTFDVRTAPGAEEGLRMVREEGPFAVVVSDLRMPVMDGLAFLYCVQQMAPDTVRVILTGYAELQSALLALNSELAWRFLEKPCGPQRLEATLREAVERHKANLARAMEENARRIIAHDIKGPIMGITGLTSLMLKSFAQSPETQEMLESIHQAGRKTLRMIDSASALHAIERGDYTPREDLVDVPRLLEETFRELTQLTQSKNIRLESAFRQDEAFRGSGGGVVCDRFLLECILGNVLRNAVEACPEGGAVTVLAELARSLSIRVRNAGEVPACVRPNFFEKYVTCGKTRGAGLGTYSARLMTKALGGDIRMDDSEPGFTTIRIILPAR